MLVAFTEKCHILRNLRRWMADSESGDTGMPWEQSIYQQLHKLAEQALMRENAGHSLQPTLLVNDAYMRLLEQKNVDLQDRSRVMAVGGTIIRRLLVDYARRRKSIKCGGEAGRGMPLIVSIADSNNPIDMLQLNDALEMLASENPRAAQVVEMKFFGGLTGEEIAKELTVSLRTVNSDWQ